MCKYLMNDSVCTRAEAHGPQAHVNGIDVDHSCGLTPVVAALHAGRALRDVIGCPLHQVYGKLRALHAMTLPFREPLIWSHTAPSQHGARFLERMQTNWKALMSTSKVWRW